MPSTVVKTYEYNPDSKTLRVTYLSGNVYDYLEVPEKVYKLMKASVSKGRYLNKHIKGHYDFVQID
jgi:hypothetical protein